MDTKLVSEAEEITRQLLSHLNLRGDVVVEIEEDEVVRINIEAEDEENLGLVIGHHGSTLYALQLILSLMVNQGREDWLRVKVDINNYRENRNGALKSLAHRSAKKAKFLEEEVALPPMNSFDRRIVHMEVAEMESMESESIGKEPERRVIIRPQS